MAAPLIVRAGTARSIKLGPDPWCFLAAGNDTDDRFDLIHGSISYLQGPPLHVHEHQDDTFYVLEGVLTIQVGDEIVELHPGDVASAPKGTPHTFTNVYQDIARVINVMTPGGLDRCLEEYAAIMGTPPDPARFTQEHGITMVGPTLAETLGLHPAPSSASASS